MSVSIILIIPSKFMLILKRVDQEKMSAKKNIGTELRTSQNFHFSLVIQDFFYKCLLLERKTSE